MNAQTHRLIFNRPRGCLMAVAETAHSVNVKSGGDTTLQGAVIAANTVNTDTGENLNIQSLQDTSTYNGKQQSLGGSVTFGAGLSGSLSAGQSKANSNFASVAEQSGIRAGDGGFNVNVKDNTTLNGAAITSTQAAIDANKNSFNGNTAEGLSRVTTSDIQNHADFQASSLSLSTSGGGAGQQSGQAASTTTAAISNMAGNKAARTGDKETGIGQIFEADKVMADVNAQTQITQSFGQQASKAVGDYADRQAKDPGKTPEEKACWAEIGNCRVALHTVVGGLSGGVQGALGAGTSQLAIDRIGQTIASSDLPTEVKQVLIAGAGTLVGAAVGGSAGAVAAGNATVNNYLTHNDVSKMGNEVAQCQKKPKGCSDDEAKQIANKYIGVSNQNIAVVQSCISAGDVSCVQKLEGQAASSGEVIGVLPLGFAATENILIGRQNNVNNTGSVNAYSLFGTDVQQAQEVATFRQSNCSGMNGAACDTLVKQAQDDRMTRVGVLMLAGSLTPAVVNGVRSLRAPGSVTQQEALTQAQGATNSGAKFVTKGAAFTDEMVATNPAVKSMFEDYKRVFGGSAQTAREFTQTAVESGVNVPVSKQVGLADTFVRMVPLDSSVPGVSSFYVSQAQYNLFVGKGMNAAQIADALGLPASSFASGGTVGFQAYSVQPKPGQLTTVYQSTIAPVEQGGYSAQGGATQYIVPELNKFTAPKAIPGGTFAPVPSSTIAQPSLAPLIAPVITSTGNKN